MVRDLSLSLLESLSLSRSTIRKRNAVGLLVDYPPSKTKRIRKVFITNDLTEPVLKEAIHLKSDFIVSYHPTPFRSFKKVVGTDRTARIVLECVANGIAVYSPHTASDAAVGTWCSKKKRLECYENSDTNARTQAV